MGILRPDRLIGSAANLAKAAFGSTLKSPDPTAILEEAVSEKTTASTPIILASVPGYDASFRVEGLMATSAAQCVSIAMGSTEGTMLADQAIGHAARTGGWVLLKNVHLASEWLGQLEKRLRAMHFDPRFRIFLTTETSLNIPVSILLQSRIIMNEPAPGIRASLLDSLHGLEHTAKATGPTELARLLFLMAWFHAIVQERSRYHPLGWSQSYDFNNADLFAATRTIECWVEKVARGRSNIDPMQIPWDALRALLRVCVYGGRVDSAFDQQILDSFTNTLFEAAAYEPDFKLVEDEDSQSTLKMPDGRSISQYKEWAANLPEENPHSWLGLPAASERVLSESKGKFDHAFIFISLSLADLSWG